MIRPNRLAFAVALVTVLLVMGAVWSQSAQAQISPFKGSGPKLDQSDLALMDRAAEPLFQAETFKPGATQTWTNARTGASGAVTMQNERHLKGLLCRSVKYEVMVKGRPTIRPYLVDWCRTPDGTWKMR